MTAALQSITSPCPSLSPGWNLMMDDASHDPIGFHLAKLLNEHLLRNRGNGSLQIREAEHVAVEEMKQDQQLPASLQNLEGVLDTISGSRRGPWTDLTFR